MTSSASRSCASGVTRDRYSPTDTLGSMAATLSWADNFAPGSGREAGSIVYRNWEYGGALPQPATELQSPTDRFVQALFVGQPPNPGERYSIRVELRVHEDSRDEVGTLLAIVDSEQFAAVMPKLATIDTDECGD